MILGADSDRGASEVADHSYDCGVVEDPTQRVTNPARFLAVHAAAEAALEALRTEFDVVVVEGLEVDPALVSTGETQTLRIARVLPTISTAAPITFAWDDFPGLTLRFGRCFVTSLPSCGCDYCDDNPDDLVEDLQFWITATSEGGFEEDCPATGQPRGSFHTAHRGSATGGQLDVADAAPDIPVPPGGRWHAWPRI